MRKLLFASAAAFGATLGLAGGAKAQPVKPVAAGTLVVHLNGYLQFSIGDYGSTFNKVTTSAGTFKLNPVSTIGDVRLYPGFDAMTATGLDYGAQVEVRTGYSDAGVGQNGKPIVAGTTNSIDGLYVKRAYGYVGTPDYGFGRLGMTDGAFTLFQTGVVEAFGDGGQWTIEGGVRDMLPSGASPGGSNQFIYADQTPLYATDKVVYISPAIAGLSAAVSYEPNSNGVKEGYNSNTIASSTSAALSSSPIAGDIGKRRKNTVDGMIQYSWKGNGFVVKASGGMLYGQPISYDGPVVTSATALRYGYDDLQVYQLGGQVTYAGVTLGANIKGGQVEDGYTFKPKGARDGLAYILSATYVLGPYVLGASYFNSQTSGAYVPGLIVTLPNGKKSTVAKTLSEYGIAVGANYVISPNLSLFTQYMYGHRHQLGNASFVTNGNNSQVQVIAVGGTMKW
jgi:hypothetical protein